MILALEISTEFCSVSLTSINEILLEEEHTGAQSSTRVLPLIQTILHKASIDLNHVTAIAFGAGPGSFTGVRSACALAQGLAFGKGLPIIPIDTLMACAERARQEAGHEKVLVTLDARMGEIYWGEYYFAIDTWQILTPPSLAEPMKIQAQQLNYCVVGNASELFHKTPFNTKAQMSLPLIRPRADYIGHLAHHFFLKNQVLLPEQALPIYVRNKVALTTLERQIQTQHKRPKS